MALGLSQLLQTNPHFCVIAQGGTGAEAVDIAAEHQPDVMLMDIEMPGPDVRTTLAAVLQASPTTAVIILTMHDNVTFVRSLVSIGAAGYLLKSGDHRGLVAAIHAAGNQRAAITVTVSRSTIHALARPPGQRDPLTPREREIMQHVAAARSNAEIADLLYISVATVKPHLTSAYAKLGAAGRIAALSKARSLGIIDDDLSAPKYPPPHNHRITRRGEASGDRCGRAHLPDRK